MPVVTNPHRKFPTLCCYGAVGRVYAYFYPPCRFGRDAKALLLAGFHTFGELEMVQGGDSHVLIPALEKAEDRTVRRLQAAGIKLFGGVEGAKAKLYIISMTWKLFEEATRRFRATECVG